MSVFDIIYIISIKAGDGYEIYHNARRRYG